VGPRYGPRSRLYFNVVPSPMARWSTYDRFGLRGRSLPGDLHALLPGLQRLTEFRSAPMWTAGEGRIPTTGCYPGQPTRENAVSRKRFRTDYGCPEHRGWVQGVSLGILGHGGEPRHPRAVCPETHAFDLVGRGLSRRKDGLGNGPR